MCVNYLPYTSVLDTESPYRMSDSQNQLPVTDAYVQVRLLNGGSMIAEYHKLHKGEPAEEFRLYNWAFFICHAKYKRHIIWDLGMSSVRLIPVHLAQVLLERVFTP